MVVAGVAHSLLVPLTGFPADAHALMRDPVSPRMGTVVVAACPGEPIFLAASMASEFQLQFELEGSFPRRLRRPLILGGVFLQVRSIG